jgi:hypothetical protein
MSGFLDTTFGSMFSKPADTPDAEVLGTIKEQIRSDLAITGSRDQLNAFATLDLVNSTNLLGVVKNIDEQVDLLFNPQKGFNSVRAYLLQAQKRTLEIYQETLTLMEGPEFQDIPQANLIQLAKIRAMGENNFWSAVVKMKFPQHLDFLMKRNIPSLAASGVEKSAFGGPAIADAQNIVQRRRKKHRSSGAE